MPGSPAVGVLDVSSVAISGNFTLEQVVIRRPNPAFADVARIAMEFIQRPQRRRLLSALPCCLANIASFAQPLRGGCRSHFRDKRRRPTVNLPAGLDQSRKRL